MGETSPQHFLFATKECLSLKCTTQVSLVEVYIEALFNDSYSASIKNDHFVCFQLFDQESCSFEELPLEYTTAKGEISCLGCAHKELTIPKLVTSSVNQQGEIHYREMVIRIGDCVVFEADLNLPLFNYFDDNQTSQITSTPIDDKLYPEKYRKFLSNDTMKDCYHFNDLSRCCQIGFVREIIRENAQIQLSVNVFYR